MMPEFFDFAQIGGKKRRTGKKGKGKGKKGKGTRRRRRKSH
jgi:hypothetical protein